jgi:hypothetical protein
LLVAAVPLATVVVSITDGMLPDIVGQLNISVGNASLIDAITVTGAFMVPARKPGDRCQLQLLNLELVGKKLTYSIAKS